MKLIAQNSSRSWYLVKEWTTKAGLKARINQCVWSDKIKHTTYFLHDHYTGYVEPPKGDKRDYYIDQENIDVHGGITWDGEQEGVKLVGFDLAHIGDENIVNPLSYAEAECEKLAAQIVKLNSHA